MGVVRAWGGRQGHSGRMADSVPDRGQSVRHPIGMLSAMGPECCPASDRKGVRHGPERAVNEGNIEFAAPFRNFRCDARSDEQSRLVVVVHLVF